MSRWQRFESSAGVLVAVGVTACGGFSTSSGSTDQGGAASDPGTASGGTTPVSGEPSGGSSGTTTTSSGGMPNAGSAGTPSAVVGEPGEPTPGSMCVYPAPSTELPSELRLGGVDLLEEPAEGCLYALGDPVELEPRASELRPLLQYDVNGDRIDDLFFGGPYDGVTTSELTLYLSSVEDGELSFVESDCAVSFDPAFRSVYVRDLNADGAPDWIVGTENGIRLLWNLPEGLREVGSFAFGGPLGSWVGIVDVAAGDFDGNGATDVAAGFDQARTSGGADGSVEIGVVLLSASGTATNPAYDASIIANGGFSLSGVARSDPMESGYVTAVTASGADWLFGLRWSSGVPGSVWAWPNNAGAAGRVSSPDWTGDADFVRSALLGTTRALAIGQLDSVLFYDLESADSSGAAGLVLTLPNYYPLPYNTRRELGGGVQTSTRFLLDVEGDGDDDLIESYYQDRDVLPGLVVHTQRSALEFDVSDPLPLEGATYGGEDPFVSIGPRQGRVFLTERTLDGGSAGQRAFFVRALGCQ